MSERNAHDLRARLVEANDAVEFARRRILYTLSPLLLVQYLSWKYRKSFFHPQRARRFEDKILWMMLYWRHPLKTRCADKHSVRSYLEEHGLGRLLPRLLGVYPDSRRIDYDRLPERFVLKCTHGTGFNLFCRDKSRFDRPAAAKKLDRWLRTDISKINGEVQYAPIEPLILCEELLGDPGPNSILDYKIYCFSGRPHCTMVCSERDPLTHQSKFEFYDLPWENKLAYLKSGLASGREFARPAAYEDMLEACVRLAAPFPFVRMDFYSVGGRAIFGEMTFTPRGGIDIDLSDLAQNTMGDLIHLPEKLL